jgi:acylphosphatase
MVTKRFIVSGRVQGVGFRYFVVREAEALGLAGWVRNLPDGRVEVLASGDGGPVDTLEGRLWQGPPHAHVAGIEWAAGEPPATAEFRVMPNLW